MRRCIHEGCGKRIQPDSVTGLCLQHYNEERLRKALPVPICEGCGEKALNSGNTSGLCIQCFNAARRSDRPMACADCGASIGKHNRTGRCAACVGYFLHPNARRCQHEGCRDVIQKSNRSGLCRAHKHVLRAAVPNEASVALARHVGDALGVKVRDIFGRRQDGEIVEARAIVAQKLRERGLSWNRIGQRLGRDHSSVINLVKRLPEYAARNPRVAAYLDRAA